MKAKMTPFLYRSAESRRSGAETSATVMQPDIVAAAHYSDDRRAKTLEPERNLMLAVLEDAVRCFQENYSAACGNRKRIFNDAQRWIFQPNDDWIFSFENVCAALALDPQYLRRGLTHWKEHELTKQPTARLWGPAVLRSGTHA
jgi:hypothetical protein